MDEVLPDLFVSGLQHTKLPILQEHQIKTVLTVREVALPFEPHTDIQYFHIKMIDTANQDLAVHFPEITRIISEGLQRGRVLVHCLMGMSRSVSAILAYMIHTFNIEYEACLAIIKDNHPWCHPNYGFSEQLEAWYLEREPLWNADLPAYRYHRDLILAGYKEAQKKSYKFNSIAKILKKRNH